MQPSVRKEKVRKNRVFEAIVVFFMALFAFSFLLMFVWMFFNSFRLVANYNANPSNMFDFEGVNPGNLFDNYKKVFEFTIRYTQNRRHVDVTFGKMLLNSLLLVLISVGAAVVFPPAVGYVVAKYKFRLRKFIITAVVLTMCIPTIASVTSTLVFFDKLHLTNTWLSVVLMHFGGINFGVLLYSNYFGALPTEYIESAKLDGASNMRTYLSIMLPQAMPIITAQIIFAVIGSWNDYMTPFMYLRTHPNVAYGVNSLSGAFSNAYPVVFAALFMTSAVTLIIYACFSKTVMSSLSAGGVKG